MAVSGIAAVDTSASRATPHDRPGLFELPTELIDAVLSFLTPVELVGLFLVCRTLRDHAENDIHWHRHVLANLPGNPIKSPYPCKTWRDLFVAHNQYWFLTRNKIWFCDRSLTGQMIIVRYDERRGCIEGYQLLATRRRDGSEPWLADPTVHIHHFEPIVKLHLDKPILQFNVDSLENLMRISLASPDSKTRPARRFFPEHPMRYSQGSDPRFSTFVLAKPLPQLDTPPHSSIGDLFPYNMVWPPPTIPAAHRVLGHPADIVGGPNYDLITSPKWRPVNRSEVSDTTFRIRQWMELGPPTIGFHIGEEWYVLFQVI